MIRSLNGNHEVIGLHQPVVLSAYCPLDPCAQCYDRKQLGKSQNLSLEGRPIGAQPPNVLVLGAEPGRLFLVVSVRCSLIRWPHGFGELSVPNQTQPLGP